jgi:hypothetical protein
MPATLTYPARHATHFVNEIDKLACAARDLITVLEEVQGFRTCDPRPSDVERFNRQQAEIAGLMEAYITAVHREADDHDLEEDGNADIIQCSGFDCRGWKICGEDA